MSEVIMHLSLPCHRRIARPPLSIIILVLVALLGACRVGNKDSAQPASERPPLELARQALPPNLVKVQQQHGGATSERLLIVLGENHASVQTQQQLADLLSGLAKADLLQAILIEGSNGPIEMSQFSAQAAAQGGGEGYWKQALQWGQIAGYEYVALTHPQLAVYGVEDMGAKMRFQIKLDSLGKTLRAIKARDERAQAVVAGALRCLESRLTPAQVRGLRREATRYQQLREARGAQFTAIARESEPITQMQVELARFSTDPGFREFLSWQQARGAEVARIRPALARLQGASATVEDMQELAAAKERIEEWDRKLQGYQREHAAEFGKLTRFLQGSEQLEKQLAATTKRGAVAAVDNQFFVLANLARSLDDSKQSCAQPLDTFFVADAKVTREQDETHSLDLAERDDAMVHNSLTYLDAHTQHKRVVLLVGAAHLDSIAARLKEAGASFIAGKIAASDAPIEPWEERAWAARRRPDPLLFADREPGGLKEATRLNDQAWQRDQLARLKLFQNLDTGLLPSGPGLKIGPTRLYESGLPKEGSVMKVGRMFIDRNANVGDHVLAQGPVPGKTGEFYVVYDRVFAQRTVQNLSSKDTVFGYFFQTQDGYRVHTPQGEVTLASFADAPPRPPGGGGPPRRVVLFGEPDDVPEGGGHRSPLWSRLRGDDGGGGGKKPPQGAVSAAGGEGPGGPRGRRPEAPRWTHVLALGGHRRVQLLRTVNPARAQKNLVTLGRQDPRHFGAPTVLKEGEDLTALHFTPERGDHAQMVVLLARNVAEFRAQVRAAAEAKKLVNKQVALIICGDAFAETAALREMLLSEGAVMVWTPNRQLPRQEAGERLIDYIQKTWDSPQYQRRPAAGRQTIDQLIDESIRRWVRENPEDLTPMLLFESSTWVFNYGSAPASMARRIPSTLATSEIT